VGDEASVRDFYQKIVTEVGQSIDVLVHAAGISPNTPLDAQTPEEGEKVLKTNLIGTFLVVRGAETCMRASCQIGNEKCSGAIVLLSSSNAINSFAPISAHYDASKAGVVILTRDFAKEYAQYDIRVNSVAP
jgi:NAD(P)-dependent dehydrogenase (short-subunit alcohol dehydrogenase family)